VVVKVLHPDIRRSGSLKTRFFREMDALARFETPHIVAILDKGETPDGNPFFVMEYVEGSELRRIMKIGRMDFARVARLMRQIGQALSYAHDRHVFHRDLKPENIMLRLAAGDESAVLLDFGIATVKEWQPRTRGAKTAIIGTPAYMAPEQIEGEPSAASDIRALGVIAYEMLTGRQPFPVPHDKQTNKPLLTELYKMQQAGVQLKPIKLRPDLPEAAQAALLRALAFDPQTRHAEARDFGEELAEALTGERLRASSSAPTEIITPGIDERTATLSTIVRAKPESAEVVISFAAQDLSRTLQIAERLRQAGVACWMADHAREVTSATLRKPSGRSNSAKSCCCSVPTPPCNRTRSNRTCNWPGATSGLTCRCSSNELISPSRPSTCSKAAAGSKRPMSRPTIGCRKRCNHCRSPESVSTTPNCRP
jgi:serine/threonine-protein kinase